MTRAVRRIVHLPFLALMMLSTTACDTAGGFSDSETDVLAPGVDLRAEADGQGVEAVEVGHRLISAGEYELAIKSFNRAALERGGLDAEILSGLGTAELGLGRLGEAERLLERAIAQEDAEPVDYNNYAVLLMETGRTSEAVQYFKRAFALSNGENIAIRDNLRLALAKFENSATLDLQKQSEYKLVRRGKSDFVIRQAP